MESTTITYSGMKLDIDYDVDEHGDVECITDVTYCGVSIFGLCEGLCVYDKTNDDHDSLLFVLQSLVQKEIDRETGPDEFEGWRAGQ